MSFERIDTVSLPTYALGYLLYGDSSGIDEENVKDIDLFIEGYAKHTSLTFDIKFEEVDFTHTPEFGLPCECMSCEVWGHTVKK